MSLQASEVFSATHTCGRSRATHARSHPNTPGRRHILAAKPRALRNSPTPLELRRQEPAPRRLAVLYKPGLHRPAVPCTPVGAPALRSHRQAPPNQRPVLRSRSPESYKPGPMRWPLKMPKRLRRERELYPSPISLVVLVLYGRRARTFNEDCASWFEAGRNIYDGISNDPGRSRPCEDFHNLGATAAF